MCGSLLPFQMHPSSKAHDALSNHRKQRLLPHRTPPLKLQHQKHKHAAAALLIHQHSLHSNPRETGMGAKRIAQPHVHRHPHSQSVSRKTNIMVPYRPKLPRHGHFGPIRCHCHRHTPVCHLYIVHTFDWHIIRETISSRYNTHRMKWIWIL